MTRSVDTTVMAFSPEVASRLSRLSERQLSSWSARGLYSPQWHGFYSFVDLVALRTLYKLRTDHNIRPRGLERAAAYMRKHSAKPWSELRIGVAPNREVCFAKPGSDKWEAVETGQQVTPVALEQINSVLLRDVKTDRTRQVADFGEFETERGVCGGRRRFKGTRIPVESVVELLRRKMTTKQILTEFPSLDAKDVTAARKLAAA